MEARWAEKQTVKKGNFAEEIIDKFLISKNVIPYIPNFDGAHPFDRLCAKVDKKSIYILDIKAKASRNYYPDTGINYKHYKEYDYLSKKYKVPIVLIFVDEYKAKIYGNSLANLIKPVEIKNKKYPLIEKTASGIEIIYFPLINMKAIDELTEDQVEELKQLSTRNYEYNKAIDG